MPCGGMDASFHDGLIVCRLVDPLCNTSHTSYLPGFLLLAGLQNQTNYSIIRSSTRRYGHGLAASTVQAPMENLVSVFFSLYYPFMSIVVWTVLGNSQDNQ